MNSYEIAPRNEQLDAIRATYDFWLKKKKTRRNANIFGTQNRVSGKQLQLIFFAKKISAKRILIVTNRPSVADSWAQDFYMYIQPNSEFVFAAPHGYNINVHNERKHVYSRSELTDDPMLTKQPLIYFISLQNLKGKENDNYKNSNRWIFDIDRRWDLLIIDEGHEGVKTSKTDAILKKINTDFTLYLSGTPFRAIADHDFSDEQIYNWSYLDEQKAKLAHEGKHNNPYLLLPKLQFDLYQPAGITGSPISMDELFKIKNHEFIHKEKIKILLKNLAGIFKIQNDSVDYRHSLWMLSGVEECRLLKEILDEDYNFSSYETILAIGKNDPRVKQNSSLQKVRKSIGNFPLTIKTITLSCRQLTTGITIPEWSTIVMLRGADDVLRLSSTNYIQTIFRAQSPWGEPGKHYKDKCRVIDFMPSRAITALKDYSENLCASSNKSNEDELIDYIDITIHEPNSVQHLNRHNFKNFAQQIIGEDIVEGRFLNLSKLCNDFKFDNLSKKIIDIIERAGEINDHHTRRSIQAISDTRALAHREIYALDGQKTIRRSSSREISPKSESVRNTLRPIISALPLLLHFSISEKLDLDLLLNDVPDSAFKYFLKISKNDFISLCDTGIFNQENLSAAINEFTKKERDCANYYNNLDSNIFKYLAPSSSPENYTPIKTAKAVLERVNTFRPDLLKSKDTRFFDPYTKSGNLLIVTIATLYKNLRPEFLSDHDCLYHILSKQIFSWSPNQYLRKIVLNNILNFQIFQIINFTKEELENIERNFEVIASSEYENKLVGGINMRFNVILSNPPYQTGRHQTYADFYRRCVDLDPDTLCMIFPMGWQKPQNHNGLGQLNNEKYKRDIHLVSIDNYDSKDSQLLFPGVGTGGVNIVLRDKSYDNHGKIQKLIAGQSSGTMVLPLSNDEILKPPEIKKLATLVGFEPKLNSLGSARDPYGFRADALRVSDKYMLSTFRDRVNDDDVRLFGLMRDGERGYKFIPRIQVKKNNRNLDHFKIFVPKAWGNMSERIGLGGSYANICVAEPGDCCTETFIEFAPFRTKEEAIKMAKYFMTKFFRALLFLAKTSQNTTRDKYKYIPLPDLSDKVFGLTVAQIDTYLFDKYHPPRKVREFITSNIQPRGEANIEVL